MSANPDVCRFCEMVLHPVPGLKGFYACPKCGLVYYRSKEGRLDPRDDPKVRELLAKYRPRPPPMLTSQEEAVLKNLEALVG